MNRNTFLKTLCGLSLAPVALSALPKGNTYRGNVLQEFPGCKNKVVFVDKPIMVTTITSQEEFDKMFPGKIIKLDHHILNIKGNRRNRISVKEKSFLTDKYSYVNLSYVDFTNNHMKCERHGILS